MTARSAHRNPSVLVYVGGLAAATAGVWVMLLVGGARPMVRPAHFWLFTLFILLGELVSIKVPREDGSVDEITTSATFSFSLLLGVGLAPAILAQSIASVAVDTVRRRSPLKSAFNVAQYTLSLAAAGMVLQPFGLVGAFGARPLRPTDGLILLAAGALFTLTSSTLTNVVMGLDARKLTLRGLGLDLPFQGFTDLILLGLSPIVVLVGHHQLMLTPLLALPMFAVARSAQASVQNLRLVRELRQRAEENEHLALHDALTGLPNRTLFRQSVDQAIRLAQRQQRPVAVMLLDLDRFKEINDTLGHRHGDIALKEVATRISGVLRDSDVVARLGGDEFGVLLTDVSGEGAALAVAGKIIDSLQGPLTVEQMQLEVTASLGLVLFPDHQVEVDADELMRKADVAMYAAKEGPMGSCSYRPELDRYSPSRLTLVTDLRQAVEDGQLVVHYHPKASLDSGEITGVEALVRWEHPTLGLVPPSQFVPLAETTGLITQLTRRVLRDSLTQVAEWRAHGLHLSVAVNLSVNNLMDADFAGDVGAMLREHNLPPSILELEITESSIMRDPQRALDVLQRLHAMGVGLSIDDFGTGYSSLAYLRQLPVQSIKIDRAFVMNMDASPNDEVIVRSTIEMARNLGLQVVAEGVESLTTWYRLASFGCDQAQGFFLTRPMPAAGLASWLDAWTPPMAESHPALISG